MRKSAIRELRIRAHMTCILRDLGLDVKSPSIRDTPKRVAKMYCREMLRGLFDPPPKFTVFPNDGKYDQMVVLKDIRVVSVCEHHLLPFTGRAHIAYIPSPKGKICGISKLSRTVDWYARRPQVQERLTQQVADCLNSILDPKGVMVVIEARHHCMICRGVMEDQAVMVTSAFHGVFKNQDSRAEFLSLIGKR